MSERSWGPALVAAAALLWATDALFRFPAVNALDPTFIVFAEHFIGLLILLPWALLKRRQELFRLRPGEWLSAAVVGIGASAIASIFFTASFRYLDPSVVILLQKLQPVLVVLLALVFLGERPRPGFFGWAALALVSGVVLSFPDLRFDFLRGGVDMHSRGILYSIAAAAIWAAGTVAGKSLLRGTPPSVATFWRFAFGLAALGFLLTVSSTPIPWAAAAEPRMAKALLYMGLFPGILAMLCYYGGLKKTPAIAATFIELLFPVAAVLLNTIFLGTRMQPVQLAAGAALLFAVTMISYDNGKRSGAK